MAWRESVYGLAGALDVAPLKLLKTLLTAFVTRLAIGKFDLELGSSE